MLSASGNGRNLTERSWTSLVEWKWSSVDRAGATISPVASWLYSPGDYVLMVNSGYYTKNEAALFSNPALCGSFNSGSICQKSLRQDELIHLDFGHANFAPGSLATNPILPVATTSGTHTLIGTAHVGDAAWYDPELASGYDFETSGGSGFAAITGLPRGFQQPFDILVNGAVVAHVAGGGTYSFTQALGHSVSKFGIRNIVPGVDPNSPTAFPIGLTFDSASPTFTMTATDISAVPEAQSSWNFLLGTAALGGVLARRRTVRA